MESSRLSQHVRDDAAMHVGQSEISASMAVGKFFVVEAHQVEDRGVEIMDVDRFLGGFPAEFVGGAVYVPAFHTTTG